MIYSMLTGLHNNFRALFGPPQDASTSAAKVSNSASRVSRPEVSFPAQWDPRSLGHPTTHLLTNSPSSITTHTHSCQRAADADKQLAAQLFLLGAMTAALLFGAYALIKAGQ